MSMNYEEVLSYLYNNLPMFQRIGGAAYKKDLENTLRLCAYLENPERKFRSVHVAGTNGKGSSSHYLASILQEAGYRVGLYTSPHLKSFTERIRINGREISREFVTEFVNTHLPFIESLAPSFFEITVGMAFDYFAIMEVDIAVIEVGMGGRLDSTNVITPEVALITNISLDHQQWLGNDLASIAAEKAGVIKPGIPVVIGEYQPETAGVFEERAGQQKAPLTRAYERSRVHSEHMQWTLERDGHPPLVWNDAKLPRYQQQNLPGVAVVIEELKKKNFSITDDNILKGISEMKNNTGMKGRWDILGRDPLVICDVGHNVAGFTSILNQLKTLRYDRLHIVLGLVADKDIRPVLKLLPKEGIYYFCEATIPRALEAGKLQQVAAEEGIRGQVIRDVNAALVAARSAAGKEDVIFVGGSNFVVAELNEL